MIESSGPVSSGILIEVCFLRLPPDFKALFCYFRYWRLYFRMVLGISQSWTSLRPSGGGHEAACLQSGHISGIGVGQVVLPCRGFSAVKEEQVAKRASTASGNESFLHQQTSSSGGVSGSIAVPPPAWSIHLRMRVSPGGTDGKNNHH
jgi:hypothetical protein